MRCGGRADVGIGPYGGFTKGAVGRGMLYTHTYAYTLYTPAKASQSLPAAGGKKIQIIFHRDMCVGKNTSQAASVEFLRPAQKLCAQQTANPFGRKFRRNFLPVKKETPGGVSFLL